MEKKNRRKKRTVRKSVLVMVLVALVGFLVFFFLTIFDLVYPPVGGKGTIAKKEREEVVLYFSDTNERFLVSEKRYLPKETDNNRRAEALVKAIIEGSKTGLVRTIPEHVTLRGVKVTGDTVYVDFAKDLIARHPGGSAAEMATLYSLTHTLTENIPGVNGIKILVEGKEVPSIKGHIETRHLLTPDKDMIAERPKEG